MGWFLGPRRSWPRLGAPFYKMSSSRCTYWPKLGVTNCFCWVCFCWAMAPKTKKSGKTVVVGVCRTSSCANADGDSTGRQKNSIAQYKPHMHVVNMGVSGRLPLSKRPHIKELVHKNEAAGKTTELVFENETPPHLLLPGRKSGSIPKGGGRSPPSFVAGPEIGFHSKRWGAKPPTFCCRAGNRVSGPDRISGRLFFWFIFSWIFSGTST